MGPNDPIDIDLRGSIEDLLDDGEIESNTRAYGVAQQVILQGYESLSPEQKAVYDRVVVPALKRHSEALDANRLETRNPN